MRQRVGSAAAILAAVAIAGCSAGSTGRPASSTSSTRPPATSQARAVAGPAQPSPTSQPWGSCGNIRDETDARTLVTSGEAVALVEAKVSGSTVRSYRVLDGTVSGFTMLSSGLTARPGRYLILLGDVSGRYYVAFGYDGIYRIDGDRVRQLCAYGGPTVARSGVTSRDHVVALLRRALRSLENRHRSSSH